ncbi:NADPH-dependent 2,4-dienoyl-CoA reductase/sulfur reductase-like enzyme [Granulicella aggregans]|uniref:NADPH-dependent 2,4-dienoyl-CoA reductase/sulfur reductase-like enzyme n=1 Tax=Granulicella aggregans TaxID=474949 RepID=A0A7W7ZDS9_9BACT|nr:FAD/NAD(P)-binding oxidoreductase [Granulicella aggregans]MBB5057942.1 NADPH-dependent 2,4-dienoyl-CoA reductase/sulfur reductase-like enzyme [Granulicella aggregans]
MTSITTRHTEILIVGAGPAGVAAATSAASAGAQVTVLDDNPGPGGQIWRGGIASSNIAKDPAREATILAFRESKATLLSGRRVIDAAKPQILRALVEESGVIETFTWDRLILATGARERYLPFPGWTLPGVFGAGGLQALMKGGYSVKDKRIVVAGTGPLLLAVAAHLQEDGAQVLSIAEQASLRSLLPVAATLWSHPAKLLQGIRYRTVLRDAQYRNNCWPIAAEGTDRLTAVRLTDGSKTWTEPCDLLACGFHLVPNTEFAVLLGCKLTNDCVAVDSTQKTSIENVYCVGEPTGIAGLDAALVQGKIAGLSATNRPDQAMALFKKRDREQAFGKRLDRAFALRPELRSLAQPDTIVCRCEDVRYAQLQPYSDWTDAKLQTRCGMGPCQGRICGPAVQTLFGWRNTSIRPPIFPIPLSAFISAPTSNEITPLQETL